MPERISQRLSIAGNLLGVELGGRGQILRQTRAGALHAEQLLEGRAAQIGRNQHATGAVLGQGDREVGRVRLLPSEGEELVTMTELTPLDELRN